MARMSRALEGSICPVAPPLAASERPERAWRTGAARLGGLIGLNQSTSLARRFLLASLLVLVVGGLTIGWWVGGQLERGIIDRTASITGLYVESFIGPHLESLGDGQWVLTPTRPTRCPARRHELRREDRCAQGLATRRGHRLQPGPDADRPAVPG